MRWSVRKVRACDRHTSVGYIYWVDNHLYFLSLVNDLGSLPLAASFSVGPPGLALPSTHFCFVLRALR